MDNDRALPEVLPLTDRLRSLYAQRLRDLPEGTREMLLFVVLAGAENSMTLENCIPAPQARSLSHQRSEPGSWDSALVRVAWSFGTR